VLSSRRLFVDYRHFDTKKITPRFEFGFGLSYTEFQYSDLNIAPVENVGRQNYDGQLEANWLAAEPGPRGIGSSTALWLHRPAYTVSFVVKNMGKVTGTEVRILSFKFVLSFDTGSRG
jgi:beta-glucosidase